MFYQSELQFLCDTLQKSRVSAFYTTVRTFHADAKGIGMIGQRENTVPPLPEELKHETIYALTDADDLCYLCLLLPEINEPTVLYIGPYLDAFPSHERLRVLGTSRSVSSAQQAHFEEYYTSIPVLLEGNPLFVMISTFCERIWRKLSFAIVDTNPRHSSPASPMSEPLSTDKLDDVLLNIQTIDRRYAFENDLLYAVENGQLHKESQLLSAFSENAFEKRLANSLRNAKNYCIIMNTLLRKAAENGGVHPVYLDRMSSAFAAKIESMSDLSENASLMREMFRSYCRLVRKHAIMQYSLIVQKTILLIDSDLSANLSLNSLADHQNISPGYLSALFKKETGKTVSEYIREKRMYHAAHLLSTTHLQIQTVALYCGIMDVQYFSKTFKKTMGKTPKEYREYSKQPQIQ